MKQYVYYVIEQDEIMLSIWSPRERELLYDTTLILFSMLPIVYMGVL